MKNKKILAAILITLTLILIAGSVYFSFKSNSSSDEEGLNKSQMRAICELATLNTYFHNTAKYSSDDTDFFIFKHTQTLWIEYDGSVEIGTDISELEMIVKNNSVKIKIPHSTILDSSIVQKSLQPDSYHTDYSGFFTSKVGFSEQKQALQSAQSKMLIEAKKNKVLFTQADERAESLLKNYVKNIGTALGKKYSVKIEYLEDWFLN